MTSWVPLSRETDLTERRARLAEVARRTRHHASARGGLVGCTRCGGHADHREPWLRCACATGGAGEHLAARCVAAAEALAGSAAPEPEPEPLRGGGVRW